MATQLKLFSANGNFVFKYRPLLSLTRPRVRIDAGGLQVGVAGDGRTIVDGMRRMRVAQPVDHRQRSPQGSAPSTGRMPGWFVKATGLLKGLQGQSDSGHADPETRSTVQSVGTRQRSPACHCISSPSTPCTQDTFTHCSERR
jgi:hypothetical protein